MSNNRLMWVSIETRASGLCVAKSDGEPKLFVTAPTMAALKALIPVAIADLFDRHYGEKVVAYALEADNDDDRQAVAVLHEIPVALRA